MAVLVLPLVLTGWPAGSCCCRWGSRCGASTGTFDRLPEQFCQLLDRLSDHLALQCLAMPHRKLTLGGFSGPGVVLGCSLLLQTLC